MRISSEVPEWDVLMFVSQEELKAANISIVINHTPSSSMLMSHMYVKTFVYKEIKSQPSAGGGSKEGSSSSTTGGRPVVAGGSLGGGASRCGGAGTTVSASCRRDDEASCEEDSGGAPGWAEARGEGESTG